ncbi:MAG: undecaprenyl/decaprenyl-phosphate alpha-N-acetylglucosaminyl 1-phosphate transferase, partial [Bacteroidaceae bacterium]|nr:undecaprenyl/decaprenyl-phosphate alpha-N-acetylglucosaminyl 1-phosphate transferase [Bacteroidaceae bacterium]
AYTLVIIPTFDVIRVAIWRKLRGIDMFTSDKTHIHHRFMAMGLSMHATLICILSLFMLFCGLNFCLYGMAIKTDHIVLCDILFYATIIKMTDLLKKS